MCTFISVLFDGILCTVQTKLEGVVDVLLNDLFHKASSSDVNWTSFIIIIIYSLRVGLYNRQIPVKGDNSSIR